MQIAIAVSSVQVQRFAGGGLRVATASARADPALWSSCSPNASATDKPSSDSRARSMLFTLGS